MRYFHARALCSLAVTALTCLAAYADAPAEQVKPLQGTWTLQKNVQDGESVLDKAGRDTSLKIDGSKITFYDKTGKEMHSLMIDKIDAATSPQTIFLRSDPSGTKYVGIFKIDGDSMEMCLPLSDGQPKPEKLEPGASGDFLMYLKMTRK